MRRRRHSWAERWLFLQAAASLTVARLALRTTSFWRVLRWLGMHEVTSDPARTPSDLQRAQVIGWAVGAASRRLPWHSTCLMEAVAGAALLRRHSLPATLSLGVGRGAGPQAPPALPGAGSQDAMLAHAWLRCGEFVLTGEAERASYAELVSFGLP